MIPLTKTTTEIFWEIDEIDFLNKLKIEVLETLGLNGFYEIRHVPPMTVTDGGTRAQFCPEKSELLADKGFLRKKSILIRETRDGDKEQSPFAHATVSVKCGTSPRKDQLEEELSKLGINLAVESKSKIDPEEGDSENDIITACIEKGAVIVLTETDALKLWGLVKPNPYLEETPWDQINQTLAEKCGVTLAQAPYFDDNEEDEIPATTIHPPAEIHRRIVFGPAAKFLFEAGIIPQRISIITQVLPTEITSKLK